MTPLHAAVSVGNLRSTKDLLLRGADRNAKSHDGKKAIDLINAEDQKDRNKFRKILKTPWYTGCPLTRVLPYMRIERNSNTAWLFVALFIYIIVTQVVVVQPNLNVWYFMMSTSLISIKLAISFFVCVKSKPGYLERG
jgi:hypothetical protein